MLAIGSQVVGQGCLVYALGQVPPLVVGLALLTQPAVSAAIGWLAYDEVMTPLDFLGAFAIAAALVYLVAHACYKGALFLVAGAIDHEIGSRDVTVLAGVPPLWIQLAEADWSGGEGASLRTLTNSGGHLPAPVVRRLRELFPDARLHLMYGLTEAFRSTYLAPEEIHRSSPEQGNCIGKAIPNTEIMVITREGKEAAPGEPGELVHRGPTVAMGYWGNEEATRKAYRPNPLAPPELLDVERVVYSGDTVERDAGGYLYFLGREDAMIKNQGYRLSPEEVENLLLGSGLVHEACAFGVENPAVGQDVIAVISLRNGSEEGAVDRVREYAINNGPPYMIPKEILVRDELPKTGSGKIDRKGISSAYSNG